MLFIVHISLHLDTLCSGAKIQTVFLSLNWGVPAKPSPSMVEMCTIFLFPSYIIKAHLSCLFSPPDIPCFFLYNWHNAKPSVSESSIIWISQRAC